MSGSDMNHMNHIVSVTANDVNVLREKESTYAGSWKRAGGRSAWFMMRRNMDRLITMMKPPEVPELFRVQNMRDLAENIDKAEFGGGVMNVEVHTSAHNYVADLKFLCDSHVAEDIFAKIQEHPAGEDGTVLACLRDLRRYLVLIEAEMVAEGTVQLPGQRRPTIEELEKILKEPEKPVVVNEDGSVSEMKSERRVPRYEVHGVETGSNYVALMPYGQQPDPNCLVNTEHVNDIDYLEPWIVSQNYFKMYGISAENREKFWSHRAKAVHVLEPHVESATLPRVLHGIYVFSSSETSWTLDMRRVPPSIRSYFPNLGREKNMKEHEELPRWQRSLYVWDKDGQKYRLSSNNLDWHSDK